MRFQIAVYLLFLHFILLQSAAAAVTTVNVVTESSPPYQYLNNHGQVAGLTTDKVRRLLSVAQIDGNFALYPWARTVSLAEREADTLIYAIARTQDREKRFQWIARVSEFRLAVVGLRRGGYEANLFEVADLVDFTFAVQRDDIAHHWLLRQGFLEGENMIVCADIQCSWKYLLRGIVDFIVEDPSLIAATATSLDVDGEQLQVVVDIPELDVIGYLAASNSTAPAVVQRLKDAAQQLGMEITSDDALAEQ